MVDDCCGDDASCEESAPVAEAEGEAGCSAGCCDGEVAADGKGEEGAGCNDGCCGSKVEAPVDANKAPDASCNDGCCGSKVETVADVKTEDCSDGCCGPKTEAAVDTKTKDCNDGCCSSGTKPILTAKDPEPAKDCADGCCVPKPAGKEAKDPTVMDCCRGKPSPCCDESCLERLALRECDSSCSKTACGSSSKCMSPHNPS